MSLAAFATPPILPTALAKFAEKLIQAVLLRWKCRRGLLPSHCRGRWLSPSFRPARYADERRHGSLRIPAAQQKKRLAGLRQQPGLDYPRRSLSVASRTEMAIFQR